MLLRNDLILRTNHPETDAESISIERTLQAGSTGSDETGGSCGGPKEVGCENPIQEFLDHLIVLVLLLVALALLDIRLGSVTHHLCRDDSASCRIRIPSLINNCIILTKFRLPRLATALLAGAALPVCGLQMQTLFRNPLAGPYVLGHQFRSQFWSGTGGAWVPEPPGSLPPGAWPLAAWIGAGIVMLLLLFVSFRIKDVMTILILGIMFSSGSGSHHQHHAIFQPGCCTQIICNLEHG